MSFATANMIDSEPAKAAPRHLNTHRDSSLHLHHALPPATRNAHPAPWITTAPWMTEPRPTMHMPFNANRPHMVLEARSNDIDTIHVNNNYICGISKPGAYRQPEADALAEEDTDPISVARNVSIEFRQKFLSDGNRPSTDKHARLTPHPSARHHVPQSEADEFDECDEFDDEFEDEFDGRDEFDEFDGIDADAWFAPGGRGLIA